MTLFVSQSLESLADALNQQLLPRFAKQAILVPNTYLKRWLLLALAKRQGIAMGLQIFTPSEWLVKQGFMSPNSLEMRCLIYRSLQRSKNPDLARYLESGQNRLLDLTEPLSSLFFEYGQFGKELFEKKEGWQEQILQELFVKGPWKLPVQWLGKAPVSTDRIHCFGIDSLAPAYWEWLLRFPSLSIYLFSPCLHYWGDVCSDKERRQRLRYWRKLEVSEQAQGQLEEYLLEAPSLLGNWGKLGRETLKLLDPWELEVEERYEEREENTLLRRLQGQLLTFRSEPLTEVDNSIQVVRTGASIYREVEWLRDEIVRLVAKEGLRFDEVTVLAPQIDKYAPWISLLFSNVPYRIYGVEEGQQSPFSRAFTKLAELAASRRWSAQEVLSLFEASAFARKQNWSSEELETLKKWGEEASIDWGFDEGHRREVLAPLLPKSTVGAKDSWEMGLDALLDRIVFFKEGFQVDPDLFEEFLMTFHALKKDLLPFQSEATLAVWADRLEGIAASYLFIDSDDESWGSFRQLLATLRQSGVRLGDETFPFSLIEQFLGARSVTEEHASQLHAVRFAPLEEGSLVPTRALFLVGMDEESFPAKDNRSSLNLLKKEKGVERYRFLQALFSTTDFLRISYGHLSPKEGKEVAPSLVVQELLSYLDQEAIIITVPFEKKQTPPSSSWLQESIPLDLKSPQGEVVIPIRDLSLLARHPWKFYLQKTAGLFLKDEREDTFGFLKSRCLRASLQKPLEAVWEEEDIPSGSIGEALRLEMQETREEWEAVLEKAGAKPLTSLQLRDFVVDVREDLKVRLVGEIENVSPQGLVIVGEDHFDTVLKAWPEALVVALAQNTPQVLCLKTGKMRQVHEAKESLRQFIEYYFLALQTPSPLLPDWADGLLRRGPEVLDKKLKGSRLEDPVFDWVIARYELPTAAALCKGWGPRLQQVFAPLIALYPVRGKHAEV